MGKKNKVKKVSVKRERYKKFRKEKGSSAFTTPDPTVDEMKEIKESEARLESFLKSRKPHAPRVINERKLKSKRDRI